jgi:RNA polymerase sigma-70 factor (ECF subfamily)
MSVSPITGSAGELFIKYGATVFRRCRRLLGDDDRARDAVQEVFLKVVTRGETFRGDASPLTWIYGIATRHCLQQLRNQHRRREKLERLGQEPPPGPSIAPIDRLAIGRAMSELDPLTVEIAVLRHVDAMTLEEVAEVTGVSRKTVQKRLERFKKKAGAALLPEEVDERAG